jgi:hypothetical protein
METGNGRLACAERAGAHLRTAQPTDCGNAGCHLATWARADRWVRLARAILHSASALTVLFAGCGAPGEPTPPAPPVPVAVADLSARQSGDGAQLSFTLPTKALSGDQLAEPPAIEVLRGAVRADGMPDAKSFRVVETIPGTLAVNSLKDDRVEAFDPIAPEETRTFPGASVAYAVRTRASQKRASANSNAVVLRLYPVPESIPSVQAGVTEKAIELSWVAPSRTSGGEPLKGPLSFRVYRGEIDPGSAEAAAKDLTQAKWRNRLALLGPADAPAYHDTSFEFGKTYVYAVRSTVSPAGEPVESAYSAPAVVAPVDTFPPAAPSGVVAAVLRGVSEGSLEVELSWSINGETDLAGYRVYRSEREDTRGVSITPELLPTPAIRDTSVQPGHRYWYSVTAVDRAGNESASSQAVAVEVTQPSS